ncbi:piggyBac transposable element-derived protein 3-like [Daktulosphaira vitifoliae]|uniref:piggyBac transposable element-derived protein 3-like n=1 Tax=Daktulosphaira vitifoliae TaxID=58002 RepID=UPI0021AA54E9|nr:piggyBac transposable element-derived protein 3-like [Daktulosphaira vitifoliae]
MVPCPKAIDTYNSYMGGVYDNKLVNMVSTYVGSQPIGEKKRFFRSKKKYKMVPCPKAIDTYNSYMGGVDLLDSMLGYYRISIKSKKYYIKIFFHVLDLCVVNAWLLYRRVHTDNSYLPLVDFKLLVSEVLCEKQKVSPKRRGRPTLEENTTEYMYNEKKRRRGPCKEIPEQEVRLDGYDHYPIHTNNRIRCKYPDCNFKTMITCQKCTIPLCINKERNCFLLFHTV